MHCGSSSRRRGLVCSVWLWYFLIVLTCIFRQKSGPIKRLAWSGSNLFGILMVSLKDFFLHFSGLKLSHQNKIFLNKNICCGYSKEPSQWDDSFEHPKHMLKLMGKKIFTIIYAQMFCLSKHMIFDKVNFNDKEYVNYPACTVLTAGFIKICSVLYQDMFCSLSNFYLVENDCRNREHGFHPTSDCRFFLLCYKSWSTVQICPHGTIVNPLTKKCDIPWPDNEDCP